MLIPIILRAVTVIISLLIISTISIIRAAMVTATATANILRLPHQEARTNRKEGALFG